MEDDPVSPCSIPGSDLGGGGEQGLGVGVARCGANRVSRAALDNASQVHHGDLFADVAHDAEVVGDKQVGDSQVCLQSAQQIHDVGLAGDVKAAYRLVQSEQRRARCECSGDRGALELAPDSSLGYRRPREGDSPTIPSSSAARASRPARPGSCPRNASLTLVLIDARGSKEE